MGQIQKENSLQEISSMLYYEKCENSPYSETGLSDHFLICGDHKKVSEKIRIPYKDKGGD